MNEGTKYSLSNLISCSHFLIVFNSSINLLIYSFGSCSKIGR